MCIHTGDDSVISEVEEEGHKLSLLKILSSRGEAGLRLGAISSHQRKGAMNREKQKNRRKKLKGRASESIELSV